MSIKKGRHVYHITENDNHWTITSKRGRVLFTFHITKYDCPSLESVIEYVQLESEF